MDFEFNGENLDVPNDMAVVMLSNSDLADGVNAFAEDYDRALGNKIAQLAEIAKGGGDNTPELALETHKLIIALLKEAARRLRVTDTTIADNDPNWGMMKGFGN